MRGRSRPRHAPAMRPAPPPIAEVAAAVAPEVVRMVVRERRRLAPALATALKERERLRGASARAAVTKALSSLLRWWGWIELLRLKKAEEQLLLASLLDSATLTAPARAWAERAGRSLDRVVPVGDAPNWTARAEGLKRWTGGAAVNADPWRLFPDWIRDAVPTPPGEGTPKTRRLEFLAALQSCPAVWVAARAAPAEAAGRRAALQAIWTELRDAGLKPWVHRRAVDAAKLPPETDLSSVPAFQAGRLIIEDLAAQTVGLVCDPSAGERWWQADGDADQGRLAAHLAALMGGKGSVVCSFHSERRRHVAALALRAGPWRNITTKTRDGGHPIGKPSSFDGVVVGPPCSGIGRWRRAPDARWTVRAADLPRLAEGQSRALEAASSRVKRGGTLVYTVETLTRLETFDVVEAFMKAHPEFQRRPFPAPLDEGPAVSELALWPHVHDCEARFIARLVRR